MYIFDMMQLLTQPHGPLVQRASWLANLLAIPRATTLAWMHLLLLDLFQARCGRSDVILNYT